METYRDNKDEMKDLGLPYKLGLLLYGEAGTGKSSTILTVASYLGKNLYYVNLRGVRTNAELKHLFQYVNQECAGGGIMVFEDIDVMHPVVHPREKTMKEETTMHSLLDSEDDKLTLSYFLNLLDGTLQTDDTLFIMTTSRIGNLDSDLIRPGRVDVRIELKRCDHHQIKTAYKKFLKKDIPQDVLECIEEYKHKPAEIIYEGVYNYIHTPDEDPWVIMENFIDPELKATKMRQLESKKGKKSKLTKIAKASKDKPIDQLVTFSDNQLVVSTVS